MGNPAQSRNLLFFADDSTPGLTQRCRDDSKNRLVFAMPSGTAVEERPLRAAPAIAWEEPGFSPGGFRA